jgi:hypothetical protein
MDNLSVRNTDFSVFFQRIHAAIVKTKGGRPGLLQHRMRPYRGDWLVLLLQITGLDLFFSPV